MTDPVRVCSSPSPTPMTPPHGDDVLRETVGTARPDASATHHREEEHGLMSAHGAGLAVELGLEGVGAIGETALGSGAVALEMAGPAAAVVGGAMLLYGAWFEADEGARQFDSEMMRGALAAFEGRLDDEPVQTQRQTSPGFDDGARRVERLALQDPARFDCLRQAVMAVESEGASAVYTGRDSGAAFDERFSTDLPFRHGVERARKERITAPDGFETHRREATEMRGSVSTARASVPMRG